MKKLLFILFFLIASIFDSYIFAATRTASVSGNWSSTATWGGQSVPTSADDVIIGAGKIVTVDIVGAQCLSLTFTTNGNSSSLIIGGSNSLIVSGNISYTIPKNNNSQTISVGDGSLSCSAITMSNTLSATKYNYLTISTGSISVSGNINCPGSSLTQNQITFSGSGTINIGGSFVVTTFTFTPNIGTINYNGGSQTIYNTTYYNLALSGSGTKTLPIGITNLAGSLSISGSATTTTVVGLTISGNLNVGDGANFNAAGYNLTVTGTTNIGGGTSGNINITSATGTKIFTGLVTLNTGATWSNTSANSAVTFKGGLINNGTFNAGTGLHSFDTNSQAISGNISIPNITVTGVTLTNNGTLNVATALNGTGGITQGNASFLNIGFTGSVGITTITATATDNTINYNFNGSQTIRAITYHHLTISSGGTKTLAGNTTINGNLNIAAGNFDLGTTATTIAVSGSTTINGSLIFNGTSTKTVTIGGIFSGSGTLDISGGNLLHILNLGGPSNSIGTFTTAAVASTVNYNASGDQSVFSSNNYRNLTISGTGTKSLSGIISVNNNFNIAGGTLNDNGYQITGNLTGIHDMSAGTALILGNTSSATSMPTFAIYNLNSNSTVTYNSDLSQTISSSPTYGNLTLSAASSVTKSLVGTSTVNGTLSITNTILNIAGYDLNLGSGSSISGTFSSSNMIVTSGGNIVKQFTSVPLSFTTFPLGTGTIYTPADIDITTATVGGTGSISIRPIASKSPNQIDNTNSLSKYWIVTTSNISNINASLSFTYDESEADVIYESAYVCGYYNGSTWSLGTNNSSTNTATISLSNVSTLSGNYTAATEYGLTGNITYFTRANGNWETASTWSTISHTGAAALSSPIAGAKVDIGGGFTVTKTTSTALSLSEIIIDSDGVLNMGIQTGLTVTTLNGNGKIQLGTGTFPTVTTNNFIATAGSTVEYNNTTSFTLPAAIASYQNLTISSTGIKTLGVGIIVNGDLNVSSGTLQLSTQNISVTGTTYLGGIITDNNLTGTNTFNIVSLTGGTITGTATPTYTINGALNISTGNGTLAAATFVINGVTTIDASRTLTISSATGTKTFGDITVNGIWSNTANEAIVITGNLTVNTGASFTSGTAAYTFSGASKSLGGTISALSLTSLSVSTTGSITNNIANLTIGTLLTVATPGTFTNGASNTVTATTALSGTGSFIQGISSILNLGGTCGITTLTATANPNTVNYVGAAQTVKAAIYYHLSLSGSGTKTMTSVATINGDLTLSGTATATTATAMTIGGGLNIGDGTAFTAAGFNLTVTGTTTIGNSLYTGALVHSSITGTKTFSDVIVNGVWTNSINEAITISGNLTVNAGATFTSGTAAYTFSGASKSIGGTISSLSIASVSVSTTGTITNNIADLTVATLLTVATPGTFTNGSSNTVTATTALSGTGSFIQGTSSVLNLGGTCGITTLTATANPNTVNYIGAIQTAKATTYHHLNLSGSGAKTMTGITTLNGDLTMSGTATATTVLTSVLGNVSLSGTANTLTTGAALVISGTLTVGDGCTFTSGAFNLTVNGTTTVGGGTSGILVINSATGTKTFSDLTVNGTWTNSINEAITITGNLTVNTGATFTAGTAAYTFSGTSKEIGGTIPTLSIPSVSVSATGTITNNIADLTVGTLLTVATPGTFTNGDSKIVTATTSLAGTGSFIQSTNSVLNIGNTCGITTLTAIANPNTVNYTRANTQTAKATTYHNLGLGGTSAKTLTGITAINGDLIMSGTATASYVLTSVSGNISLNGTANTLTAGASLVLGGNLSINDGCTFTNGAFNLTINGTTTIGNGTNGTLTISSATGTKIFTGLVTVNAGAIWNNSGNSAITFRGGITNNGTFTAGTGINTFDTNTQAITGTFSIPRVTINGISLTNNNTLSVTTALAGTGALLQASSSTLNIGFTGAIGLTTLTATANGNTVNYNFNGAQTVKMTDYYNLSVSVGGTKTLEGNTSVAGDLNINAGTLDLGTIATTLSVTGNASVIGILSFNTTTTKTVTITGNLSGAGTINMSGGSLLHNLNLGGTSNTIGTLTTATVASTVNYSADVAQSIFSSTNYRNLTTSGSGTKTLSGAITVNNNLNITGALDDNGNQITGNVSGSLIISSGAALSLGNTSTATALPSFQTYSFDVASTVIYNSDFAQTISSSPLYGNLILTSSSPVIKTLSGNATVNGNFTNNINNTLDNNGNNLTIKGNIINNGITTGTGKVYLNGGTANHQISGNGQYSDFELDDSNGATFTSDASINGNLSITSGDLTSSSGNLNLAGNFINNSVFNHNSGTVTFNGASQTISGTTGLTTFNNVIVNNGSFVDVSSTHNITTSGTLTVNGSITLNSDATSTSTLIDNGISGTGTFTSERYLPSTQGWYTSSPISNGTGSIYSPDASNQLFKWNEPTGAWVTVNSGDNLVPMKGYPFKSNVDKTISYSGSFNTGSKNIALTKTGTASKPGWNLVGNPYPSAIDWEAAGWTKTNIYNNTFWIRSNGVFLTYNGNSHIGVPEGTTSKIPAHQAFWVVVDPAFSTGSIGVNNSARIHDNQNILKNTEAVNFDILRINITKDGFSDQAAICFTESAATANDPYDSQKSVGVDVNIPQIYTLSSANKLLAINSYPNISGSTFIKIGYKAWVDGVYAFSIANFTKIPDNIKVLLEDTQLGVTQDMRINNNYVFNSIATANNTTRFKLIFDIAPLPVTLINFSAECQEKSTILNWTTASETNNKGFYIEKSIDGKSFNPISFIEGKGNSSAILNYLYEDNNTNSNSYSYYRLKQIDFNGIFQYSNFIISSCNNYSNPEVYIDNNDLIIVSNVNSDNTYVSIVDLYGNYLYKEFFSNKTDKIFINNQNLPAGVYLLNIINTKHIFSKKILLK